MLKEIFNALNECQEQNLYNFNRKKDSYIWFMCIMNDNKLHLKYVYMLKYEDI